MNQIISYSYIAFVVFSSALYFSCALIIWALTALFDRRLVLLHMFTSFWSDTYIRTMPAWSVTVTGREKLIKNRTYVIVSNHQSMLDILAAYKIYFPFKWVSKKAVFKLPFIGWNMYLNRYIGLKRGDKESITKMLSECEKALKKGSSIYMFPEGTRSETQDLKPFKPGFATLAKKTNVPILPVVINGSRNALPKKSLTIKGKHNITLTILDEIPPELFLQMTEHDLSEYTRKIFQNHLNLSDNIINEALLKN